MRLPVVISSPVLLGSLASAASAALLGQPVTQAKPAGPQRNEDSGGQLTDCTYRAGSSALIVSVVEFASAAEARKQLTANLVRGRLDADDAKVSEESGVGEKSYYGAAANGATYVFLKKNKVGSVGVGGGKPTNAAAIKEPLRGVAQSVAAKI